MFSNRIESLQSSAIREILKLMREPGLISFGGGNPSVDAFPVAQLKEISNELFDTIPEKLLAYGVTEGQEEVVQVLNSFFARNEEIKREFDHHMLISGSQQGMDFLAKVLCNEGDVVICEDPTFLGGMQSFKSNGANLVGCPVQEDGIDVEVLENLIVEHKPKIIYVIPNFQNPTGITMSFEKRKKVYELACKYNVIVLEDDPYGSVRFKGEVIPSIKSLDVTGHVVYLASLSKIISPGMRVAYMVGRNDIIAKCTVAKQVNDVHTNVWSQYVMMEFIKRTDMDNYLVGLSSIYKEKCELMLASMEKEFIDSVSWTKPEGGMFIWVTLPKHIDCTLFVKEALNRKVAVVPGNVFYTNDGAPCSSFRVNYSMPSNEDIIKGISILGTIMKEMN